MMMRDDDTFLVEGDLMDDVVVLQEDLSVVGFVAVAVVDAHLSQGDRGSRIEDRERERRRREKGVGERKLGEKRRGFVEGFCFALLCFAFFYFFIFPFLR